MSALAMFTTLRKISALALFRTTSPVVALVLVAVCSHTVLGGIVTYKQGSADPFLGGTYTGTEDVMLVTQGGSENENFGARHDMEIGSFTSGGGVRHGLVRFDITSLNGQFASIDAVTLRFFVNFDGNTAGTAQVFRLAPANTGWVEGTHTSAFEGTATGESTWLQRVQGSQNWAGSQGASTAGTDYLTPLISSQNVTGTAVQGSTFDFVFNDVSFISAWAAGNNPGLFLRMSVENVPGDNRISFFSRNNANAALHPELIITFTAQSAVPEPGSVLLCALGSLALLGHAWRYSRKSVRLAA